MVNSLKQSIKMKQRTLEGTWEEILQYSTELTGQRVRLTILPTQSSNLPITEDLTQSHLNKQPSNLEILQESGLIGCISAESDLSTNYKSVLQKGLDDKYDNR